MLTFSIGIKKSGFLFWVGMMGVGLFFLYGYWYGYRGDFFENLLPRTFSFEAPQVFVQPLPHRGAEKRISLQAHAVLRVGSQSVQGGRVSSRVHPFEKPQLPLASSLLASPIFPPKLISSEGIFYPEEAREKGWEGIVRVHVHVGKAGDVLDAELLSSSGRGVLDQAALASVRSWRFEPATQTRENGKGTFLSAPQSVNAFYDVPVRFQLDS